MRHISYWLATCKHVPDCRIGILAAGSPHEFESSARQTPPSEAAGGDPLDDEAIFWRKPLSYQRPSLGLVTGDNVPNLRFRPVPIKERMPLLPPSQGSYLFVIELHLEDTKAGIWQVQHSRTLSSRHSALSSAGLVAERPALQVHQRAQILTTSFSKGQNVFRSRETFSRPGKHSSPQRSSHCANGY